MTVPTSRAAVGRGVMWTVLDSGTTQLLATAVFFVIARFVTPAEFGALVGAVLVIDFFRSVVVEAISTALMAMREPEDEDYNACFILMLGVTITATVLIFFGADLIASVLPLEGLHQALRPISFLLITTGVCRTHEIWLSRHLEFRALTIRSVGSVALGGATGACLAVMGYGIWALVAQQLVASLAAAILLWLVTPWRPHFRTTWAAIRTLLRYARHVMLMNLTNFANAQSDTGFTAYYLGSAQTGLYGAGKRIGSIVSNILSTPLGRVAMPTLASLQTDDARLRRAYLQAVSLTASVTAPAFAGMAALSTEVIATMLGSRWTPAGPVLAALAASYFMVTVGQYNFSVMLVKGKPHWLTMLTGTYAVVNLVTMFLVVRYGMIALALAISARAVLLFPLSIAPALRLLELRPRDYLGALLPPVGCALLMAAVVFGFDEMLSGIPAIARLALLVPGGALLYGGLLMLLRPTAVREITTTVRLSFGRAA
jgi:O-antigen/teichoic acid export membrane protein